MYQNDYNESIAKKVRHNAKKQIERQEAASTMGDSSFTSHLEGMALRDSNIEGGSGYASATVRDLGFPDEKTNGVVGSGEPVAKKKRTRKSESNVVGGANLGLTGITTDPRGDPAVSEPHAQIAPTSSKEIIQETPVVKSEMTGVVGGAKKRSNKYALLVKEVMAEHKFKLPEASAYIKANNLYKK